MRGVHRLGSSSFPAGQIRWPKGLSELILNADEPDAKMARSCNAVAGYSA
jgi:hypothetical protein